MELGNYMNSWKYFDQLGENCDGLVSLLFSTGAKFIFKRLS